MPYLFTEGSIAVLNHCALTRHFRHIGGCTGAICTAAIEPRTTLTARPHYGDVIMGAITSQISSLTIVYSTVYSDADQRKHQSSASLVFVRRIHRSTVNSPHKWPVTRKMFPFDDVIMSTLGVPSKPFPANQNFKHECFHCDSIAGSVF